VLQCVVVTGSFAHVCVGGLFEGDGEQSIQREYNQIIFSNKYNSRRKLHDIPTVDRRSPHTHMNDEFRIAKIRFYTFLLIAGFLYNVLHA